MSNVFKRPACSVPIEYHHLVHQYSAPSGGNDQIIPCTSGTINHVSESVDLIKDHVAQLRNPVLPSPMDQCLHSGLTTGQLEKSWYSADSKSISKTWGMVTSTSGWTEIASKTHATIGPTASISLETKAFSFFTKNRYSGRLPTSKPKSKRVLKHYLTPFLAAPDSSSICQLRKRHQPKVLKLRTAELPRLRLEESDHPQGLTCAGHGAELYSFTKTPNLNWAAYWPADLIGANGKVGLPQKVSPWGPQFLETFFLLPIGPKPFRYRIPVLSNSHMCQ